MPAPQVDQPPTAEEAEQTLAALRYRLRLHASLVSSVVIVESNRTWGETAAPMVAHSSLSSAEIARYRITLLCVPHVTRKLRMSSYALSSAIRTRLESTQVRPPGQP